MTKGPEGWEELRKVSVWQTTAALQQEMEAKMIKARRITETRRDRGTRSNAASVDLYPNKTCVSSIVSGTHESPSHSRQTILPCVSELFSSGCTLIRLAHHSFFLPRRVSYHPSPHTYTPPSYPLRSRTTSFLPYAPDERITQCSTTRPGRRKRKRGDAGGGE